MAEPSGLIGQKRKGKSVMKLEVGKYYRTMGDKKVFVIHSRENDERIETCYEFIAIADGHNEPITYTSDGHFYAGKGRSDWDIMAEWKEPASGIRYANIYLAETARAYIYMTREDADAAYKKFAAYPRIACVKFEWKEGQFDD